MTTQLDNSPMLRALLAARDDVPELLLRFDAIARAGARAPSFEEYSARIGDGPGDGSDTASTFAAWRRTCYFDTASSPALIDVANARFDALARELDFPIPPAFTTALHEGAVAGPDVLQIVLGIDADEQRPRLKYYLIFKDRSGATVERLRVAAGAPALPPALAPDSVYILGIDFGRDASKPLRDFKLYVRLDPQRITKVIRNLGGFEQLWRGSRYLVFQHCLLSQGRQVYFHASSAELLERWLLERARPGSAAAMFRAQIEGMNEHLRRSGEAQRLRPWIASFPYDAGRLLPGPTNVYLHHSA